MVQKKSKLESLAGSAPVALAAAALAAVTPDGRATMSMIYALVPALATTLASGRHQARLNEWMNEVDTRLRRLGDHLARLSDAQHRLIAGIIQTAFETIDEQKLRPLKAAVLNVTGSEYLEHFHAQLFSRIIRDISAGEIAFLANNREAPGFTFIELDEAQRGWALTIKPESNDALLVRGLINLGVIVRSTAEGTSTDIGAYQIAPFVPQLLDLVAQSDDS